MAFYTVHGAKFLVSSIILANFRQGVVRPLSPYQALKFPLRLGLNRHLSLIF